VLNVVHCFYVFLHVLYKNEKNVLMFFICKLMFLTSLSAKRTFSNSGLNRGGGVKIICVCQSKTGHISKIWPKLLLITNRKLHTPFQIR